MEATRYRVVLTGELVDGHELDRAVELLSKLFKQPPEAVKKVFRGRPVPLKQELEGPRAAAVKDRIRAAGAECRLEPIESRAGGLSLEPAPEPRESAADEQITCPKCRHIQPPAEECARCGVIFAKLRNAAAEEEVADEADPDQELAAFIGPKAHLYLSRFEKFRGGRGFALSWHWPALFVPFFWALYRKLWLWAFVFFILGGFLWPLSSIAAAIGANYIYFRHAENSIRKIRGRSKAADPALLAQAGGTSPRAVWIAIGITIALIFLFASTSMKVASEMTTGIPQSGRAAEVLETPAGSETFGKLNGIALGVAMWQMMGSEGAALSDLTLEELQRRLQLSEADVTDAWDRRMRLETYDDGFTVRSAGPDGVFDTEDDLKVEQ